MVGNNLYLKHQIEKMIQLDPTIITITRETAIPDDYGGHTTTTTTRSETVIFYKRKSVNEIFAETGLIISQQSGEEKILATNDADILYGDVFQANGREYRVVLVNGYLGICKQIELEVLKYVL